MAKASAEMSVAQLERLLSSRKAQLENLKMKRTRLQRELERVEKRITTLEGSSKTAISRRRRRSRKRPRNAKSLHEFVLEILGKNKKGLELAPLAQEVLAAGYKTNSKDFNNVVYQCVFKSKVMVRDEKSGRYRLK